MDPHERDFLLIAFGLPAGCMIFLSLFYAMVETWYRAGDVGILLLGGYAAGTLAVMVARMRRKETR